MPFWLKAVLAQGHFGARPFWLKRVCALCVCVCVRARVRARARARGGVDSLTNPRGGVDNLKNPRGRACTKKQVSNEYGPQVFVV